MRVSGEFACFTRPEMKVERVTYPVMTPSAARGVLEAIFWKPQFQWIVEEIHVLKPIAYFSILRNEVSSRQVVATARAWAQSGVGGYAAADDRTQRHTLALRDVAYVIRASMRLRPGVSDDIAKFRDQFRRRVANGRCYAMPYLGCREFSAGFGPPQAGERPIDLSGELGPMLLGIDYLPNGGGIGQPRFFPAELRAGVLHVPLPDAVNGAG
ncbi:MAG: type I-C CRISPR-associated protein Cas5 [Chloroflexi bacterium]|nr:MAG: type I-C CRISPR-associated protein Cas5 [Chloroflexota bacterium]